MKVLRTTMGAVAAIAIAGCAGPSPLSEGLGGSVPWEEPPETAEREPAPAAQGTPPTPSAQVTPPAEPPPEPPTEVEAEPAIATLELVSHGVQPVQRGDGEVVVLSVVELVNPGDAPLAIPPITLEGEAQSEAERAACAPTELPVEGPRELGPGERRMIWARSTCPIGDGPLVIRVSARGLEGAATTDVGEVIVTAPIEATATAAAD